MTQPADARDANYVLTLEEIGNLAEASGKPAETLMNVVAKRRPRAVAVLSLRFMRNPRSPAGLATKCVMGSRNRCHR